MSWLARLSIIGPTVLVMEALILLLIIVRLCDLSSRPVSSRRWPPGF
jgi:hypothetical protein